MTLPLKTFGGKAYLAEKIISLFPKHLHYVEPYAGGLAVLLRRDPHDPKLWLESSGSRAGVSELVNDLDSRLANFWKVISTPGLFDCFMRCVVATPVSRELWNMARYHEYDTHGAIDDAVQFFICCRQSMSGRMTNFAPTTRNRTRRKMNSLASEWLGSIEGLPEVHERLKSVIIENKPALEVIRSEDTPHTLFYLDPPYLPDTRTAGGYFCDMTAQDHVELLDLLGQVKGKVLLSGYPNNLYDKKLASWNRVDIKIPNHAASGKTKRIMTECVWKNF